MPGFEQLGRNYNVVVTAEAVNINMADADSITFIGTGDGANAYTMTFAALTAFSGGSSYSGWTPVVHYYTDSSNGAGTAAWVLVANNAAGVTYNDVGTGSAVVPYTSTIADSVGVAVCILASQMPAGYPYISCTMTHGKCIAIKDLVVQRRAANLIIPAA